MKITSTIENGNSSIHFDAMSNAEFDSLRILLKTLYDNRKVIEAFNDTIYTLSLDNVIKQLAANS